jgi:signal transduction histidine kinase
MFQRMKTVRGKFFVVLLCAELIWLIAAGVVAATTLQVDRREQARTELNTERHDAYAYLNSFRKAGMGIQQVALDEYTSGHAALATARVDLAGRMDQPWTNSAIAPELQAELKRTCAEFIEIVDRVLAAIERVEKSQAAEEYRNSVAHLRHLLKEATPALEYAELLFADITAGIDESIARQAEAGKELRLILGGALIASAPLALILPFFLMTRVARRFSSRVDHLAKVVSSLAEGDLSKRTDVPGSDELSRLGADINTMADALEVSTNHLNETVRARTLELEKAITALDERNREVADFAYAASHDLREPLRTIMGFAELMEMDLPKDSSEEVKEGLQVILGAGRRMQSLVADLLDLSRSGRQEMRFAPTDLNDLLAEVRTQLSANITETGAKIIVRELPTVRADGGMLLRVFVNLVANGIKYQPRGQKAVIDVDFGDGGDHWDIRITDNGIGIAPQYHSVVFEPFKRLHRQDEYEGSGIGLAVCRRTIERHGGKIRLESEPGKGSTFIVSLPKAATDSTRIAEVVAAAA